MERPRHLADIKTRFFLDSGSISELDEMIELIGFSDGVTTNPTLVKKAPEIQKKFEQGLTLTEPELLYVYREIAQGLSARIPNGSVSLEVYADTTTTAEEMFDQGREMFSWITNAHIKYPLTRAGVGAAQRSVFALMRVNITLNFSQEQAAAVFAATRGAKRGQVFISPFVGRLDDIGVNGMSLVEGVMAIRDQSRSQAEVLVASVRKVEHLLWAINLGADITTSPLSVLRDWVDMGMPLPDENFVYNPEGLTRVERKLIPVNRPWQEYDIYHPLTEKGQQGFADNWNAILSSAQVIT